MASPKPKDKVKDDGWEDAGWEDVTPPPSTTVTPPTVPTVAPPTEEPGMLSKAWHTISDPLTDAPSRLARSISDKITGHSLDESMLGSQLRGFVGGATEGVGNLVSSLTSPMSLATLGLGGAEAAAGKTGLESIAAAANAGQKLAAVPMVLHGGAEVVNPNSTLAERGQGLVEMAGGAGGILHTPASKTRINPKVVPLEEIKVSPPTSRATASDLPAGIKDDYTTWRKFPVGQTIKVSPGDLPKNKLNDALKLGFEYQGIDDTTGKVILKKTQESPKVKLPNTDDMSSSKEAAVDLVNLPRAMMTSIDMSAPLRQGLPLIHKRAFWTSMGDMVKAWGSEDAYNASREAILERPNFQNKVAADGTVLPSLAEQSGLSLTDLSHLSKREESMMSKLAEKVPGVRASNRAYTAYLNKLRADTFDSLIKDGKVFGADGSVDLGRSRALADFVNYSSGRGSLGRAERAAVVLNSTFFAPRLVASRLKILNPWTYINPSTDPMVRKEAIKSLLALATAGNTIVQLGKMAGAEVESDPNSSDFGKLKVGNVRLDPWAGAQQYVVAANRILRPQSAKLDIEPTESGITPIDMATGFLGSGGGQFKSSVSGSKYALGEKYGGSTRLDVAGRFLEGKANPLVTFATGLLRGKDLTGQPFDVPEEVAKRFVPIFVQDLKELITEDPNLIPGIHEEPAYGDIHPENLPAAVPSFFGMGMQRY